MPYRIQYSPDAEDHLRGLTARQRSIVLDTIDRQLAHQPTVETGNRKPMRQNPLAAWEVRLGGDARLLSRARGRASRAGAGGWSEAAASRLPRRKGG